MGKILAIFAVLLGTINGLAALSCLECGTYTCTPLPLCRGDVTKDVCNCCDVCAKIAGEGCGGPWGIAGTCSRGLTCVKDPNDPLEDFQSSGTCECPAHSSWNQCGSACPTTCDNLGTNVICPEVCVPSCTCDDGYVLKDGNCILEDQCGGTECPAHSSWDPCGLACPTTCDNLGTNILCPRICIAGCACDDGYVLNNGSCIPEDQCRGPGTGPTRRPPCRPHSEWNECGSACPATCADPNPEQPCLAVCAPRCVCVEGYVMDNGNCIPVDRCGSDGCDYEGNQYNDGDEWAVRESPGLGCQCEGTEVVCYVVDCAPGYQHVIGRDGLWTCERKNECPLGYLRPRRSVRRCYKLVTTGASYQNAEQQCFQDGARLVTLKAKQINKWLKNKARRAGSDMWIGLSDKVTEKKLIWSDGDPYKKSKRNNFWAKGAIRQNTVDKDCVYMSRRDGYRLRFGNCADERLFICEFVLG
ncbi:cysteine-rich motor neuron 1 protein-like isoform X1 [Branchiostoma lanceolatum]|uniref:cysteine-rich motor neuron 1 protein-like isoform X1 n=1 Tax=Branchiostoma lanceolatum TaxID=7740 RepID=UPI0034569DDF